MKEKKIRQVWPIYGAAAVWVLYAMLFPLYTMRQICIAALLSLIVFLLMRPMFEAKVIQVEEPVKPANTGNTDADSVIDRGREAVRTLENLNAQIKDEYISREISRMETAGRAIFDTVAAKPEKAGEIRKFMNYYLPTSIKLLETYRKMDAQQIGGENITATMESVKNSMDMIANAFEKQADALFSDEALDISTDVDVLETMLKTEGLK